MAEEERPKTKAESESRTNTDTNAVQETLIEHEQNYYKMKSMSDTRNDLREYTVLFNGTAMDPARLMKPPDNISHNFREPY